MKRIKVSVRLIKAALLVSLLPLTFVLIFSAQIFRTRALSKASLKALLVGSNTQTAGVPGGSSNFSPQVITRGSIKTDLGRYNESPLPSRPPAGGKVFDPVFGTEIMRVTDTSDGTQCGTAYSYWPTFNVNNTRVLAEAENGRGGAVIFKFDSVDFRLGSKDIPPRLPGSSGYANFEWAIWSGIDPDVLYCLGQVSPKLYEYNVATRRYKLVIDLSGRLARGNYLMQMSKSLDDDVFAFTVKDATYKVSGYLVYRKSTDKVLYRSEDFVDEVRIDKTGRYLAVNTGKQGKGVVQEQVKDLVAGTSTDLIDDAPDYAPGHYDTGRGYIVGADNWGNRITRRELAKPHAFTTLFSFDDTWDNDFHISMLADNEQWVLVSFFGESKQGHLAGVLRREIVQFATDSSKRMRRLLHHYSIYRDYWDSPRANISRDGAYVAFTSNWGGSSRRDLFIARINPAPLTRTRRVISAIRLRPPNQGGVRAG